MHILFGYFSCGLGVVMALSAYSQFSWGKAFAAVLLFTLGIWLIRQGMRTAGNGSGEACPDLFDAVEVAGDVIDLLDD